MTRASLTLDKGDLILTSPFDRGLVEDIKGIPYHDRQYMPATRQWRIKYMWGSDVAAMCKKHLGQDVTVPSQITQRDPGPTIKLLKVEYIGSVKDRSDGSQTATGWADGGWNVIFPHNVLRAWFADESKPDEAPTRYAQLGVKPKATADEVKKAYRLAAKTWHPDLNKDPGASEQFRIIQEAYEMLSNEQLRRKYDAGLMFERDYEKSAAKRKEVVTEKFGWQPPIRAGWITAEGEESLGRFTIKTILSWSEITNERGESLVSYWPAGATQFVTQWI